MKALKILILFCALINAQDISVKLDLGGEKFEYLEHILIKVKVINNSAETVKIHKSWLTYGPDVRFILQNSQGEIFPYTGDHIDMKQPKYETYYIIDPGEGRQFPLRGGYYFLTNFYKRDNKEGFPYLPADSYTLKGQIKVGGQAYFSEEVNFYVTPPKDPQALNLLREINKIFLYDDKYYETLKLYDELYQNHRNSIYNILAIPKMDFMLGYNKNIAINERNREKEELKERAIDYLKEVFRNNRQALMETKWIIIGMVKQEREKHIKEISQKIDNNEFIESFNGIINKELPSDLKIEKVKNRITVPPAKIQNGQN